MTDEEKAEEYVNKRPFIHLLGRNTFFIQKEFRDAILWAFAEVRKEKEELIGMFINVDLEKENKDLKEVNEAAKQELIEARYRNSELQKKLDFFLTETVAGKEYRPKEELEELKKEVEQLKKENAELKAFSKKLIETNNKLRNSLRKYEVVPDVDYLPNGIEIYKENVGNNPYIKE